MKIDPRTMHSEKFRPYTLVGAVASVLDGLSVGESAVVTECVDRLGNTASLQMLHTNVNKAKDGRVFSVRSHPTAFAEIIRIA